jgi:hypothetical protein
MQKFITSNRIKIILYASLAILIISAPTIGFLRIISDYFIHLVGIFFVIGLIGYFFNNRSILIGGFGFCTIICLQLKNESETIFKYQKLINAEPIKMVVINLSDIKNLESLFNLIDDKNPDIISFLEVTPDWVQLIPKYLSTKYPHHIMKSSADIYGKAVYSKYEIIKTVHHSKEISVSLQIKKDIINIIPIYITPSLDKISGSTANNQLKLISELVNQSGYPSIVMGQFNNVYWSKEVKSFKVMAGLKNCRNTSLPFANEVQNEISFHTDQFMCHEIKDVRLEDGSKIGLYSSYFHKTIKNINSKWN